MYKKTIAIFIFSFLFLGCSQQYNKYAKPTDILKEQALTQTKKVLIKDKETIKAFIVVTYINKINHKLAEQNEEVEKFIVSVHIPSEESQELYDKISFMVNEKKDYTVTPILNDDKLLEILPVATKWHKYYLVQAPKNHKRKGTSLKVFIENLSSINMNFTENSGNLSYSRTK